MKNLGGLTDVATWRDLVVQSGTALAERLSDFVPQLLAAGAILLVGFGVARTVEFLAGRALRGVGIDRAASRLELAGFLERADVGLAASELVARAVFWIVMLTALVSAVEVLGLTAVTATIDRLIAYIPSLIGASLILLLGLLAARFAAAFARSAAVAADLGSASRVGSFVQWVTTGLAATLALEQLGVATQVLVLPLTAVLGAVTLSAGLAFALGARPIVTHILAGHFLRRTLPDRGVIVLDGERGRVERVGPTDTVLRSDSRSWSVPNGRLMDDVVTWG